MAQEAHRSVNLACSSRWNLDTNRISFVVLTLWARNITGNGGLKGPLPVTQLQVSTSASQVSCIGCTCCARRSMTDLGLRNLAERTTLSRRVITSNTTLSFLQVWFFSSDEKIPEECWSWPTALILHPTTLELLSNLLFQGKGNRSRLKELRGDIFLELEMSGHSTDYAQASIK